MSSKLNPLNRSTFEQLNSNLAKIIFGQENLLRKMLVCLLCKGHLLVEGKPGLAKTLSVKALSKSLDLGFARIQFTPDLLPADLTGSDIFDSRTHKFVFEPGPLFHQFILADEVNRAPAKVQSALLEAMGEGQISVGKSTYQMEQPFMVIATMNPIEQEGTYQLPEAQLDRFLLKCEVSYPAYLDEIRVASNQLDIQTNLSGLEPILDANNIIEAQQELEQVVMDQTLVEYCVRLVRASRGDSEDERFARWISLGAGPRASVALVACAKAVAYLNGRKTVEPDDIIEIVPDVLRHRLQLSFEADNDQVDIQQVIDFLLESVQFY